MIGFYAGAAFVFFMYLMAYHMVKRDPTVLSLFLKKNDDKMLDEIWKRIKPSVIWGFSLACLFCIGIYLTSKLK